MISFNLRRTRFDVSPDEGRWGVYAVWFPRVVKIAEDLAFNFRHVLPELKRKYEEIKSRESAG
jgi:hypothetical protein